MIDIPQPPTIGVPESAPDELVADVAARLAKVEHLHRDHPGLARAQHVAALLGAVTCAMDKSEDGVANVQFGVRSMDHVCVAHIDAAVWLLGWLFRVNHMNVEDVLLALPEYVKVVVSE